MNRRESRRSFFAPFALVMLLVVVLAACAPSTPQSQAEPAAPVAASPGAAVAAPQEIQRVTLEESKAAFDSGSAIFVDVRSLENYKAGHIPGALSIPLDELETRIAELDPKQWIITYCT
jgi:3-mercaptopyruvate sulfurtransferase SseA